jgi:hypothetical protein
MSGWIKIGVEFIKALPGQWKGSSDPNAPSQIVDTMAEEAPRADSVAVGDESQISITSEAPPNQRKLSVGAKSCDSFSMIFGGLPTTSRVHSRSA